MQHRLIDNTQNLISAGAPLVGGGLLGFATGFAIRKIMKLAIRNIMVKIFLLVQTQHVNALSYKCEKCKIRNVINDGN